MKVGLIKIAEPVSQACEIGPAAFCKLNERLVHTVAFDYPLGAYADVFGEKSLQLPFAQSKFFGHILDAQNRAIVAYREDNLAHKFNIRINGNLYSAEKFFCRVRHGVKILLRKYLRFKGIEVFTKNCARQNTAIGEFYNRPLAQRTKCAWQKLDTEDTAIAFEATREPASHHADNFRPVCLKHEVHRRVRQRL